MKAMRSTRGRVSKPSAPVRGRPGRHQAAGQLAAHEAIADQVNQVKDDTPGPVFEDPTPRLGPEQYAAAAAAAVMEADMGGDTHGDAEAEADMEDDDPASAAAAAAAATSGLGPSHVDLASATANLLANGSEPVESQHPALQQNLPHGLPQGLTPILPQALAAAAPGPQPLTAQMNLAALGASGQPSMDPNVVKATQQLAAESGYSGLLIESALAKRLSREQGHRHAQQRRPDQTLNLSRRSNVEALFAHIAGVPSRIPCKNCHKGHGPWVNCIIVDGQMCGSCANCWFNASGARCSFHETRQPQAQHTAILPGPSGLPSDPSYRFSTPHLIPPAPAPAPAPANIGWPTGDPALQQMIARVMAEVRTADRSARQLMLIEATAKQLALQIAEYEEMTGGQEQQTQPAQGQNQGQGHGHGQGHQVMGDEPGA